MVKLFNRASIALVTNLLNLTLFSLVFAAGVLNIVADSKNFAHIAVNVYLCLLGLFLFVTEIICFTQVVQQCQFLYTHRGRCFLYLYLGCLVYIPSSLFHQFTGIYCMSMAGLLLILSFIKQFPGRCELKISIQWLRKGLSGLEPELKCDHDDDESKSREMERNEVVANYNAQKLPTQPYTMPPLNAPSPVNSVVYPNFVYHPMYRAPPKSTSNPDLNSTLAMTPSLENGPGFRYSRPSLPPNYSNASIASNIPPWSTFHPNQYSYPSPSVWGYNPSMQSYVPYYMPPHPQPHPHPHSPHSLRQVASSEADSDTSENPKTSTIPTRTRAHSMIT
ncbi:hypothetical protein K7432_003235 [Basidiobolus ranarum]|uniref:Uncharacterized protein n=1 Tax=Basidiobolus ranarum TaxID=34480 RepID=A0ABR2W6X5_9FUNG